MKLWDFVVIAIIVMAMAGAVYVLVNNKKKGGGCCGECSRCCGCGKKSANERYR